MVDNDNYKDTIVTMMKCMSPDDNFESVANVRTNLRIYNILDMNIVPINFHAFQREIAFANIFNYSYTFDHIIKSNLAVGLQNSSIRDIEMNGPGMLKTEAKEDIVEYPGDILTRKLITPYAPVSKLSYVNHIGNIMSGHDGLGLGTPKYLSGQLWNKVLLNTLYTNDLRHHKPDPGATTGKIHENVSKPYKTLNMGYDALTRGVGWVQKQSTNNTQPLTIGMSITYPGKPKKSARSVHLNLDGLIDDELYDAAMDTADSAASQAEVREYIQESARYITEVGYNRYNTHLVRNIEWFIQLQRIMRFVMRKQLSWVNDPIVHGSNALAPDVTEYDNNRGFRLADFE